MCVCPFRRDAVFSLRIVPKKIRCLVSDSIELLFNANVVDAWKVVDEYTHYMNLLKSEYYVMMSVLRILDVIVGNEPFVDYKKNKYEYIQKMEEFLEKVVCQKKYQV